MKRNEYVIADPVDVHGKLIIQFVERAFIRFNGTTGYEFTFDLDKAIKFSSEQEAQIYVQDNFPLTFSKELKVLTIKKAKELL